MVKIQEEMLNIISHCVNAQVKASMRGNSLVVQGLGLCTFTAWSAGSVPDQGTEIPKTLKPKFFKCFN